MSNARAQGFDPTALTKVVATDGDVYGLSMRDDYVANQDETVHFRKVTVHRFRADGTLVYARLLDGVYVRPTLTVDGRGRAIVLESFTWPRFPGSKAMSVHMDRLAPSGAIDLALDANPLTNSVCQMRTYLPLPSGGFVIAGMRRKHNGFTNETAEDAVVFRFRENGSLDRTFDKDGIVVTSLGGKRSEQVFGARLVQGGSQLELVGEARDDDDMATVVKVRYRL